MHKVQYTQKWNTISHYLKLCLVIIIATNWINVPISLRTRDKCSNKSETHVSESLESSAPSIDGHHSLWQNLVSHSCNELSCWPYHIVNGTQEFYNVELSTILKLKEFYCSKLTTIEFYHVGHLHNNTWEWGNNKQDYSKVSCPYYKGGELNLEPPWHQTTTPT